MIVEMRCTGFKVGGEFGVIKRDAATAFCVDLNRRLVRPWCRLRLVGENGNLNCCS